MTPQTMPAKRQGSHGFLRGLDDTPRTGPFDGRFGRMFGFLRAANFTDTDLAMLGGLMTAEVEEEPTPETEADDEENPGIRAGYTYLGQFIDHDLTFDPVSSLDRQNDPRALEDFRTPRFDLDNVYGRGPNDQPYLYRSDGLHMLLGDPLTGADNDPAARGVPRSKPFGDEPARALLGDPRNDENVIVSQLQAAFLRFHNRVVDFTATTSFEEAQRTVRYHYQWLVLNDFLPTIIGEITWKSIKAELPHLRFFKPGRYGGIMPVEFSVAAYRFGHSMIRPIYRLNTNLERLVIFLQDGVAGQSLVGFRQFPSTWAIDWRLFFNLEPPPNPENLGPRRIQPAYKIDSSIVGALGTLPASVASRPPSLAERNLRRGARLGLPSGQEVAKAMDLKPIPDDLLKVGKANQDGAETNRPLASLIPDMKGKAPLWYYILAEAQQQFKTDDTPIHLGEVGGRIVGEVFYGLMLADKFSFLNAQPDFKPIPAFCSPTGHFGIAELLKQAIKA
jgi:hypothetical protein